MTWLQELSELSYEVLSTNPCSAICLQKSMLACRLYDLQQLGAPVVPLESSAQVSSCSALIMSTYNLNLFRWLARWLENAKH